MDQANEQLKGTGWIVARSWADDYKFHDTSATTTFYERDLEFGVKMAVGRYNEAQAKLVIASPDSQVKTMTIHISYLPGQTEPYLVVIGRNAEFARPNNLLAHVTAAIQQFMEPAKGGDN